MIFRLTSFTAVFLILSCIIVAVSAAVYDEPPRISAKEPVGTQTEAPQETEAEDITETEGIVQTETVTEAEPEAVGADEPGDDYVSRTEAPSYDNACYYSDENVFYASDYGMPNCTCYAWGRAYELLGEKPELCLWDARYWYEYNLENGIYDCGDTPKEGAIACWAYSDGGPGHVAVVESVDGDTLTLSNSAYSGSEFYVSTAPVSDPSGGMENWLFQGYIYIV